ncbi:MAG TPA: type II toxin-antitoxin system Phd/YefM family antitoxin [Thermoanaerobaculia bacterium]
MGTYNVHEAKTHLSRLLDRVAEGEEIVIAKSGRPVAKLVRVTLEPRKPGRLKGRIHIAPDFDDPLPDEILTAFQGERDSQEPSGSPPLC